MDVKSIKINKRSVDITLSLPIDDMRTRKEAIEQLIELAIKEGVGSNIIKQVFDENGNLKFVDKHTFH